YEPTENIKNKTKNNRYTQEYILLHLKVDPSDADLVKAVSKQLEALEAYGLVEYKGRGWRYSNKRNLFLEVLR
ncbi:MAG: hypothetical protein ACUVV4_07070, partial [Candidatus Bathyarchaeia archaeon]